MKKTRCNNIDRATKIVNNKEVSKMSPMDKIKARKNAKYGEWTIHAVNDPNDPEEMVDYHTHGMEKYGLKNLQIIQPGLQYMRACAKAINDIAWSMIQGENYLPGMTHYVDDGKEELYHVFDLYNDFNEGEPVLRMEYLFETIYQLPTNGKTYIFNENVCEWIKMEDLMWQMFGKEPRNGKEIIHLDGDPANNAITNLALK